MTCENADSPRYRVSVIICAYNEEDRLSQCIESVVGQTLQNAEFEVLIVDNESSDRTQAIARSWVNRVDVAVPVRYLRIRHVGLSISRNTAIRHASGGFLVFIDADAEAGPGWLDALTKPLFERPEVDIVAGRVGNLNEDSLFARYIHRAHYLPGVSSRLSSRGGALTGANMAFRRVVFNVVGGFYDFVRSYGDETSVCLSYFRECPDREDCYVQEAEVFNEHPEEFIAWLKQRFYQGRMRVLILRNVVREYSHFRLLATVLFKTATLFFYLSCIPVSLGYWPYWMAMSLAPAFLVSIVFRRKYYISAFSHLREEFGRARAIPLMIGPLMGHGFSDAGYVTEAFIGIFRAKSRGEKSIGEVISTS